MPIFPLDPLTLAPLKFSGTNKFYPHYTPRDLLSLGVFNGNFFNTMTSRKDLPSELWQTIQEAQYTVSPESRNFFGVDVGKRSRQREIPLTVRLLDPYGWYQWYSRFYYGRRTDADHYRIQQWREEVVTLFHYIKFGNPGPGYVGNKITDITIFPEYRQQLLHFAYDSRIDPLTYEIRI